MSPGYGIWLVLTLWTASAICGVGQGTFRVNFSQNTYTVLPGGSVSLGVMIDPVPENALFSYGMGVKFDPASALLALAGIQVPDELNYNGVLGPGAFTGGTDGFAGV